MTLQKEDYIKQEKDLLVLQERKDVEASQAS